MPGGSGLLPMTSCAATVALRCARVQPLLLPLPLQLRGCLLHAGEATQPALSDRPSRVSARQPSHFSCSAVTIQHIKPL